MPAILSVKHLQKQFGAFSAVQDLNFEIEQGEIFSLLGPNGAGKTTTITMLSTLIQPTGGDALIGGNSITHEPMRVRAQIGVVPQEIALYDALSARENLTFWGEMYGMGGASLHRRVDAVLEQVALQDKASQRVSTFSGGMKRRVNIAVGLLHEPKILFMDEPTVGIDPQSRRSILDTVKELNRRGMTILYTTHYMEEAEELSDRVGILDHGQLIAIGTQKELTQQIGEYETLRLHLGEDQDGAALAEALAGLPQVIKASSTDHMVILMVPEAEEALAPVITRANEFGAKIHSVDIQEPNLEAVFLSLTGRALRD
jgi:ABC-2 type transport system ATP-binding protein